MNPTIDYLKTVPEVLAMIGVEHGIHHLEGDPYNHSMLVLDHIQKHFPEDYTLQLSAIFHDIGKPSTRKEIEKDGKLKTIFYGHDRMGSRIAYEIFKREGVQKDIAITASNIIENHMRPHLIMKNLSKKALKKFLLKCGDNLERILCLAEADCYGKLPFENHIPELRKYIQENNV